MRTIHILGVLLFLFHAMKSHAEAGTGVYFVSEFGGPESPTQQGLTGGIESLVSGFDLGVGAVSQKIPKTTEQSVSKAMATYFSMKKQVQDQIGKPLPYTYTKSGLTYVRIDVRFQSLVQRGDNHPSNWVYATYYYNAHSIPAKPLPTLFIFHSAIDQIPSQELKLAKFLVTLSEPIGVFIMYLPQFGPRRLPADPNDLDNDEANSDFVSPDIDEMRINIAQSILDAHLAMSLLRGLPDVDPERIYTMGISLGAYVLPLFEGMNPGLSRGQLMMTGGGDIIKLLQNYSAVSPNKRISTLWKENLETRSHELRSELSDLDPIVWGHRIRSQHFYELSASNDKYMDKEYNRGKLITEIQRHSKTQTKWLNSPHNPSKESKMFLYFNIFLPIQKFVLQDSSRP